MQCWYIIPNYQPCWLRSWNFHMKQSKYKACSSSIPVCSAGIGSSRRRNCGLWWCSFHLLWLWIKQCVLPPPALTPPLPPSSLHPPPSSYLEKALMQHPSGFHSSAAYTRFLTLMFVEIDFTVFFYFVCLSLFYCLCLRSQRGIHIHLNIQTWYINI